MPYFILNSRPFPFNMQIYILFASLSLPKFKRCSHAAAPSRADLFLLIGYFLLLCEKAHSILNGVDSQAHYRKHDKQAYHDDRDDSVGPHHVDRLYGGHGTGLERLVFEAVI